MKGGGGYGGLDVWGKSGSDVAVGCLADRKRVLVIFDCCFVMMEA